MNKLIFIIKSTEYFNYNNILKMNSNINTLNNNDLGNGYPNGMPQIDCKEKMKEIWNSFPLFVKFIILSSFVLYFLNLFLPITGFYLANVPFYTIFRIQLWRLITTTFLTTNFLNILFGLFSWVRDGSSLETSMGTIKYMFTFIMNGIMIQIIYTLLMFILFLILKNNAVLVMNAQGYNVENSGLWPIIMAEMTLLCMANPDSPMRLFFFPCVIKAKFYPFLLFGFFMLMSGFQIQFDVFAGILYGVFYHFVLRNKVQISDSFAKKCEDSFMFRWMKKFNGFVGINCGSQPVSMIRSDSDASNSTRSSSGSAAPVTATSSFQAFKGKGVVVGGSLGMSNGDYQGLSQNSSNQV